MYLDNIELVLDLWLVLGPELELLVNFANFGAGAGADAHRGELLYCTS